ncbi:MAG: phenylalanine--tRNA ligase subunit alpha [Firmicutes bacterium]|nr:phenylalanine--tRNA ligase subunit alpha [Bacillota bacterium]
MENIESKCGKIKEELETRLANVSDLKTLEEVRIEFFGKSGKITLLVGDIRNVPNEQKKKYGELTNATKEYAIAYFDDKKAVLDHLALVAEQQNSTAYDMSVPSKKKVGSLHPVTIVANEFSEIFKSMGFIVEQGNEIETEYNNFEALRIGKDHPARDMQDTFYLEDGRVLVTHTSSAQNRIYKQYGAPVRAIFPGRSYRNEDVDATHDVSFFQLEGILVDENITVANLLYFMKSVFSKAFGREIEVRLRPYFFPFTEPSFEVDVKCIYCGDTPCKVCKETTWIELAGCGMIHPEVLEMGGIDSKKYRGFAFGMGLTRFATLKYGIKDIRELHNLNFLKQFGLK